MIQKQDKEPIAIPSTQRCTGVINYCNRVNKYMLLLLVFKIIDDYYYFS